MESGCLESAYQVFDDMGQSMGDEGISVPGMMSGRFTQYTVEVEEAVPPHSESILRTLR